MVIWIGSCKSKTHLSNANMADSWSPSAQHARTTEANVNGPGAGAFLLPLVSPCSNQLGNPVN